MHDPPHRYWIHVITRVFLLYFQYVSKMFHEQIGWNDQWKSFGGRWVQIQNGEALFKNASAGGMSAGSQTIAHSRLGDNELGSGRLVLNLVAEIADIHVQYVEFLLIIGSPHFTERQGRLSFRNSQPAETSAGTALEPSISYLKMGQDCS
jgi:hypothetical protein